MAFIEAKLAAASAKEQSIEGIMRTIASFLVLGVVACSPDATRRDAARSYLSRELGAMGWTPEEHRYASGANVHALVPATSGSGKRVIVGAHFDGVPGSPGANDNARC